MTARSGEVAGTGIKAKTDRIRSRWAGATSARRAWLRLGEPRLPGALVRVGHLDHGQGTGRNREPHLETRHLLDENMRLLPVDDRHHGQGHQ
jgi:hypothetical protein